MIRIGIDFEFNLEFICTSVLFTKYQNLGKYNLRFFKNTRVQINSALNEKIRL